MSVSQVCVRYSGDGLWVWTCWVTWLWVMNHWKRHAVVLWWKCICVTNLLCSSYIQVLKGTGEFRLCRKCLSNRGFLVLCPLYAVGGAYALGVYTILFLKLYSYKDVNRWCRERTASEGTQPLQISFMWVNTSTYYQALRAAVWNN